LTAGKDIGPLLLRRSGSWRLNFLQLLGHFRSFETVADTFCSLRLLPINSGVEACRPMASARWCSLIMKRSFGASRIKIQKALAGGRQPFIHWQIRVTAPIQATLEPAEAFEPPNGCTNPYVLWWRRSWMIY